VLDVGVLPEYLIVMDDDTWMNMDLVVHELLKRYPTSSSSASAQEQHPALAVAGCRIRSVVRVHNFTIPFGGWGIILNRKALHNLLLRPITCTAAAAAAAGYRDDIDLDNDDNDDFARNACRRIAEDNIGEGRLFTNGMTVLSLMQAYAKAESYLQQTTTTTTTTGSNGGPWIQSQHNDANAPPRFGYCLHSDWAWGYFLNFYNIAIHSTEPIVTETTSSTTTRQEEARAAAAAAAAAAANTMSFADVPEDRLRAYQDTSTMQAGERTRHGQCLNNGNAQCTLQAHICHYVSATHMQALHRQQQQQQQRAATSIAA
jgi:hypothetical protein